MNALCGSSRYSLDNRHNCLVVYRRRARDWWRKTYWVVCIYCDQMQGPHRERDDARCAADTFNGDRERLAKLGIVVPLAAHNDARRKREKGEGK